MAIVDEIVTRAAETAIVTAQNLEDYAQKAGDRARDTLDATSSSITGLVPLIKKTIYFVVLLSVLFVSSVILYGVIYWVAIPPKYISRPLHFDYNHRARGKRCQSCCYQQDDLHSIDLSHSFQSRNESEEMRQESSNLNSNRIRDEHPKRVINDTETNHLQQKPSKNDESFPAEYGQRSLSALQPTAKIYLFASHTQWHAHAPEVAPAPLTYGKRGSLLNSSSSKPRFLSPKKPYFIDVSLVLAESETNRQLGMFMLEIDLLDASMSLLASSARSSMLPYESPLVSLARRLFLMLPLVLGAIPEARKVTLNCFDHFIESEDRPLAWIEVRLTVPQPLTLSSTVGPIQVLSSQIHIGKELNLVQQFMKDWFYICAMMTIFSLFIGQVIFVMIFQDWYGEYKASSTSRSNQVQEENRFDSDHMSHMRRTSENRELDSNETPLQEPKDGASTQSRGEADTAREEMGLTDTESNDDDGKDDKWEPISINPKDFKQSNETGTSELQSNHGPINIAGGEEKVSSTEVKGELSDRAALAESNKLSTLNPNLVSSQKEEKTLSDDQITTKAQIQQKNSREEERKKADRVMKGDYGPYEVFTGKA